LHNPDHPTLQREKGVLLIVDDAELPQS
jgi:hypothetical protein